MGDRDGGVRKLRVQLLPMFQQMRKRRDACRHGQRVSTERAGLVYRAQRREKVHDLCPAAERAYRQPSTNDLAKRG